MNITDEEYNKVRYSRRDVDQLIEQVKENLKVKQILMHDNKGGYIVMKILHVSYSHDGLEIIVI